MWSNKHTTLSLNSRGFTFEEHWYTSGNLLAHVDSVEVYVLDFAGYWVKANSVDKTWNLLTIKSYLNEGVFTSFDVDALHFFSTTLKGDVFFLLSVDNTWNTSCLTEVV